MNTVNKKSKCKRAGKRKKIKIKGDNSERKIILDYYRNFCRNGGVMDNGSDEELESQVQILVDFIAFIYILISLKNV